jgi:hypothetical protein
MALQRVKTYRTTTPESRETDATLLAAVGSDGKPYLLQVDETTGEIPVTTSGGVSAQTVKETVFKDYSIFNVGTVNWSEIIASTSDVIKSWSIFDSSGEVLELGVGGIGVEQRFAYIQPGGGDIIIHQLPVGSRISIRAITGNVTEGNLVINAWS